MKGPELLQKLLGQLPDFELQRELGQGGMGIVLLGRHKKLERDVAVKLLFAHDMSEQHVSRFRREAKMYAQLAHPNLVKIWDAGVDAEFPYLVLEYIRGKDLKAALKDDPRPLLSDVAPALASALAYVHQQGIVHRDIKSTNVMLRENGAPVLMDFGLAKSQDPNATQLTEEGMRVGTPYYMPPEVLLGKSDSGAAQDVYALGLVLYEVATGKSMGELDTLGHGPIQRVRDGLPPLVDMGGGQAPQVEALVERCLSPEPSARPTAAELVAALSRLGLGASGPGNTLAGKPVSGRIKKPASGRTPVTGVKHVTAALPITTPPSDGTGRTRLAIAAAAFVTLMAATGGLLSRRPAPPVRTDSPASPQASSLKPPASPSLPSSITARDGQTLLLIPAGFFTMGAARPMFPDESPQHRVYLDAYYIAKTEVTNAMYDRFVSETRHAPRERYANLDSSLDRPDHPVVGVSWHDAVDYAHWAGMRLPTEAEWEKAARGADARLFPWGNEAPGKGQQCNFSDTSATTDLFGDDVGKATKFQGSDGFAFTAPVGTYPAGVSPHGCLDMAGNVTEWVADWYDSGYYSESPSKNPTGPAAGKRRTARGGCYESLERSVRAVKRESEPPTNRLAKFGFRTASSP